MWSWVRIRRYPSCLACSHRGPARSSPDGSSPRQKCCLSTGARSGRCPVPATAPRAWKYRPHITHTIEGLTHSWAEGSKRWCNHVLIRAGLYERSPWVSFPSLFWPREISGCLSVVLVHNPRLSLSLYRNVPPLLPVAVGIWLSFTLDRAARCVGAPTGRWPWSCPHSFPALEFF